MRPFGKAPLGSSPNAVAVTRDGKTLYAANAANNAVAVVDVNKRELKGLIPTGWYPTAVGLSNDEKQLFVASGYGGQTLETLALPGEGAPFERITGFPLKSYISASVTYYFRHSVEQ